MYFIAHFIICFIIGFAIGVVVVIKFDQHFIDKYFILRAELISVLKETVTDSILKNKIEPAKDNSSCPKSKPTKKRKSNTKKEAVGNGLSSTEN